MDFAPVNGVILVLSLLYKPYFGRNVTFLFRQERRGKELYSLQPLSLALEVTLTFTFRISII